jgi:hypothetical protein
MSDSAGWRTEPDRHAFTASPGAACWAKLKARNILRAPAQVNRESIAQTVGFRLAITGVFCY